MSRFWLILSDISWTLFTIVYYWRQGLFEEIVGKAGERRQISREGKRRERKGSPHLGLLNSVLCLPYMYYKCA